MMYLLKFTISAAVVFTLMSSTATQCIRRRLVNTINYGNCHQKRILSYGCMGGCHSYTRPSPVRLNEMEHFCQCCEEQDTKRAYVRILCPSTRGRHSFRRIVISIKIPLTCSCRPCSLVPHTLHRAEPDFLIDKRRV